MGVGVREMHRSMAAFVIVSSMVLSVILAAVPAASAADAPTVTVLRENFENPNFNCDTGWDQDNREMWVRGDSNAGSGVDTWCHSQRRVGPSGGAWSAWCAVIGNNSIAAAMGLGSQANTASQRYDANMSSFIRHSLSMDQGGGAGTLTFLYWSKTMVSSAPGGYDHLRVSVSADNVTFTTIWTQPSADESSWKQATATVPANARTISFDFISGPYTMGTVWQEGAYIDNILVTQASDPSWSRVGALPSFSPGTFDVSIFVNAAQGAPEDVKLYYKSNATSAYRMYSDPSHPDGLYIGGEAVRFDCSRTGGELDYQFYSIASGGGVTEAAPSLPDAATSADITLPKTTASVSRTAAESGWYDGPVTVHLAASDARSGVDGIRYRIDDGAWVDWSGDLAVVDDGAHTLHYHAVDVAGNSEEEASLALDIDGTAPVTVYSVGASGDVILIPGDPTSGVDAAYFHTPGDEWQRYSSHAQIFVAEGSLEYYAIDRAGNREATRTLDLGDVPMSRVTLTLGEVGMSHPSGEVVTVEWTCEDPSGMVDHFEVLVDGVVVRSLDRNASTFDLEGLADGGHHITMRAVDGGGNSTYQEVTLTVGGQPPGSDLSGLLVPAIVGVGAIGAATGLWFWRSRRSGH